MRFLMTVVGILVGLILVTSIMIGRSTRIQKSAEITIQQGESAREIWERLVNEEITDSTLPWRYYAWRLNAADRLQAGTYKLEQGNHLREVIEGFVTGKGISRDIVLTYPEGFTLKQMAARTAAQKIGTEEQFLQAAQPHLYVSEFPFLGNLPPERTLEGYLFPDTYRVFADDTPQDVIRRMLANFHVRIQEANVPSEALVKGEVKPGRTLDQIIIMASIIEREVQKPEDMATVAGILWKRNDAEMGLDADATVRFALEKWDGGLTVQDLAIDSPYNTRRYRGLPPGPISNPGLAAIMAAINPKESEYWYYLSAQDGTTIYAKTNDEHNANKAKYL
jgi:UPF0755 protein